MKNLRDMKDVSKERERDKNICINCNSMFCRLTCFVYMQNVTNRHYGNTNEYLKSVFVVHIGNFFILNRTKLMFRFVFLMQTITS